MQCMIMSFFREVHFTVYVHKSFWLESRSSTSQGPSCGSGSQKPKSGMMGNWGNDGERYENVWAYIWCKIVLMSFPLSDLIFFLCLVFLHHDPKSSVVTHNTYLHCDEDLYCEKKSLWTSWSWLLEPWKVCMHIPTGKEVWSKYWLYIHKILL